VEITGELERIYGPIKEDLQVVEESLYDLIPNDLEPISTVERYILDNGGKRLRPALVLLSARAVHPMWVGLKPASDAEAGTRNLATEKHRISQKSTESSVAFRENLCQSVASKSELDVLSDANASGNSCATTLLLDRVIAFAVAAELIHMATLIHDDLLDGSVLRRGHRTINSKWGNEIAVLSGDHLYLKATEILTSEDVLNPDKLEDFKQVYRASNHMLQTAAKIFKGEVLQHQKRGKLSTTEEDYFAIIESKSASFISSCCMIGALLDGNACPGADESLAGYGLNLGIAFQIRDDILDLMGDEKKIGKAVGSDLKEGRLTLPVIHLLASAKDGDREYLESALGLPAEKGTSLFSRWRRRSSHRPEHNAFGGRGLRRIRKLLLDYGSIAYSMDVASNFAEVAKRDLEAIPDSQAKQSLISLADHVMTREH